MSRSSSIGELEGQLKIWAASGTSESRLASDNELHGIYLTSVKNFTGTFRNGVVGAYVGFREFYLFWHKKRDLQGQF